MQRAPAPRRAARPVPRPARVPGRDVAVAVAVEDRLGHRSARSASPAMTLRELAALPRDRRLALLLDDELGAGDRLARSPRRSPAGGRGRPRRGSATTTAGTLDRARGRRRSPNGRDRGTTRSASATASGCSCCAEPLADDLEHRLAPVLGHSGSPYASTKPSTPPLRRPSESASQRASRSGSSWLDRVVGRRDRRTSAGDALGRAPARSAGSCARPSRRRRAPRARSRGRRGRRARSAARSVYSYAAGVGAGSDSPCPRAS